MVACALTGNTSGEATNPLGNILREAMRHTSSIYPISQQELPRLTRTLNKHRAIGGRSLGLPFLFGTLDRCLHGATEVRGSLKALNLDNLVLSVLDDDLGGPGASGVGPMTAQRTKTIRPIGTNDISHRKQQHAIAKTRSR